jgi:hypothetical protein
MDRAMERITCTDATEAKGSKLEQSAITFREGHPRIVQ